ncbi:MAG: PhzF family phenazine biosynthesis protein [Bacteroidetes bacterium]|nr:MAG: PhzF family phenazine biosynthesis protein [Bacteroidota bacterium]
MEIPVFQVDAFTKVLFGGNPAAVCPLSSWLPDDILQNIAAENNLSETAFWVPRKDHYHLRWFTPTAEVDLCGHATLASAHVLFSELGYDKSEVRFWSKSGFLSVKKDGEAYVLDFPADTPHPVACPEVLSEALQIPILNCVKGRDDLLVQTDSEDSVRQVAPDFGRLKKLPVRGVIVTAMGASADFVSRCFYPAYGINEDPVTGSAHTLLTPFWANITGKKSFIARQISARGGHLQCKLEGDRVFIGGGAKTFLKGHIYLDKNDPKSA